MSDRLQAKRQALADHRELVKTKIELIQSREQTRAKVGAFIEGAEKAKKQMIEFVETAENRS